MAAPNFIVEKDASITTITFNRPERRNCLDAGIILEFERHLHAVRDDRDCRVLIVTGAGSAFCAGADSAMFKSDAGAADQRRRMGEFGRRWPRLIGRAFDVLANLDQITIGAINGYAVGGGWSFALAFDFAIAVEAAEFWVPEVDLNVPFRGAPANVLSARLGPWRAKEAILMCRHYSASELFAMGVINRVVKPDELMPAARELALTMAAKSPDAVAASKRGINAVFFGPRQF
ncbi:MAG: enoyl-CoA hydratase/isomerase family protein [Candidatus Binatus sp.]|uniref:enoyl-CoA hydratase/isomerase family protein n=1 Tax=Candidatus Binatus sp. TaxID=2811406 RepID=UPI0027277697|nr:enoyl-CoA hydratase/isomerase family protein [Candidatus Binatus sp.]MDO8434487.1 enoyl-CoA hydratase/isomerase family protein [Candidatus Binatus sp.]